MVDTDGPLPGSLADANRATWRQLEQLAEGYRRTTGVRPDRLRLGARAADLFEPRDPSDAHPRHLDWWSPVEGVWQVAQPPKGTFLAHWRCWRQHEGHWWHPIHATMIDWFCCACGTITSGIPKDGTHGW